ncbi:hypothetical protein EC957_002270 [Mortierella hygrophila]|uniref:F-box domain-containing protein n=1 Tax=Mortierella hygrophila TaxID=979708 RepID=A0A9P6F539_9FUNG|nr:hypothetical protein EC957_002270 [Mortierella hygrophila]
MHPLRLPELRILIGQYLPQRDILACILVSKAWHADFQSLLFRSITLDDATIHAISKEALHQHAHLIRHLVLSEPMRLTIGSFNPNFNCCHSMSTPIQPHPPQSPPPSTPLLSTSPLAPTGTATKYPSSSSHRFPCSTGCRNLLTLDIHPSLLFRRRVHEQIPKYKIPIVGTDRYNDLQDDFWCLQSTDACIRLIQQNPNLQSLTESFDEMSPFHRIRFTKQLCELQHHNLRIIHLSKWEVSPIEFNLLIDNSRSLFLLRFSKLTLKNITGVAIGLRSSSPSATETAFSPQPQSSTPPATPVLDLQHLKVLVMTHATFQMSELRIEAPSLIVINLSFSQVQCNNAWSSSPNIVWNTPSLQQLVHNRTERSIGTASLLSSPRALCAASFADYELPAQLTTEIVTKQGQNLQSLRLACFTGVTPEDLRLVLTNCPNLVTLCAPEIRMWAGDLVPVAVGGTHPPFSPSPTSHDARRAGSGNISAGCGVGSGGDGVCATRGRGVEGSKQHQDDQEMPWGCGNVNFQPTSYNQAMPQDSGSQKEWICHKLERLSIYVSLEPVQEDDEMMCYPGNVQEHGFGNGQGLPSLAFDKDTQARLYSREQPHSLQQDHQQKQSWHLFQHRSHQHQYRHHRQHQEATVDLTRVAFLNQLSKLRRLKHLDLSGEHVEKASLVQIGLPWTLPGGIEQLATLQELEHIAVTGWVEQMGPEEISWMKRSWPKLQHVSLLKTDTPGISRFQGLLAKMWPELTVQDKARNKGFCPPLYLR